MPAPIAELESRRQRELEEAVDRNCRLMELARHNGLEISTQPMRDGEHRIWMVPAEFVSIVGYQAAVVR